MNFYGILTYYYGDISYYTPKIDLSKDHNTYKQMS